MNVFHDTTQLANEDAYGLGILEDWQCVGTRAVQASQRIGAAAPVFFDRLTRAKKVRLTILRIHATQRAAIAASFTPGDLAGVADLKLVLVEGLVTWQAVFAGCKWGGATTLLRGRSVEWTYEVELSGAPTITETP